MASSTPVNSTNVRVESPLDPWPPRERARRAPLAALLLWVAFVAGAAEQHVLARLEPEAYAALAAFAAIFAAMAACLDAEARALLARARRPLAGAFALDALALLGMAFASGSGAMPAWAGVPAALAMLVAMPLAVVLHIEAARAPRFRRGPARSPGAKRAAT